MDGHHKLLGGASPEVWVKVMTNQPHHPILGHLSGAELGLQRLRLYFFFTSTFFIIELMKKKKTHKHTKESKHTYYLVFLVSCGTNTAIL